MIIYPDLWKPPWWRFDQVNPPCCWGDGGRTAEMSRPRLQDGYHCHQASGRSEWPQRWEVTSKKSLIIELCYVYYIYMGMDQYLLIPFLVGWTSIYQLFWCSPGVQGFDTLPYIYIYMYVWFWYKKKETSRNHWFYDVFCRFPCFPLYQSQWLYCFQWAVLASIMIHHQIYKVVP